MFNEGESGEYVDKTNACNVCLYYYKYCKKTRVVQGVGVGGLVGFMVVVIETKS